MRDGDGEAQAEPALTQLGFTGEQCHPLGQDAGHDLLWFGELLRGMDYADASLRPLLDLEGLKEWRAPRVSGYAPLERAVDEAGFYDADGAVTAADYQP